MLPTRLSTAIYPPFDLDRESAKQYTAPLFSAFPDVHVTIEDMVAEGDRVVTRWIARGTHQGELMGIAPTGKTIAVMGISIGRHDANGQLLESWTSWDRLSMLQQLDINLVPERAREAGAKPSSARPERTGRVSRHSAGPHPARMAVVGSDAMPGSRAALA